MKDENKNTKLKLIFFCVNMIANGNIELLIKAFKEKFTKKQIKKINQAKY